MAKKTANPAPVRARGKGGSGLGVWVVLAMFVAAVIWIPAVAALLIVGLAPSIVSWLANRSANRQNQLLTVLAFNMAGVAPYLAKVLHSPQGLNMVMEITGNVFSWLVMYGSAAAAMVVLLAAPQAAALVLQLMAQERLKNVARAQQALIDEWGEAVSGKTAAD